MAQNETYVIVGAGIAGGTAAETLRKQGFDGEVHLVGAEPHRPYDRPPLSKEFLSGAKEESKLFFKTEDFYAEQSIELHLGTEAASLDPSSNTVTLSNGESLHYDKLLLATGSQVKRLPIPGSNLDGVHYLRNIEDSKAIAQSMKDAGKVVVVGAGFIGSEVAAVCKTAGLEVTVLEIQSQPMAHILGTEMGAIYANLHTSRGIDLRLGEGISEIRGQTRAQQVITDKGNAIDCDLVVIGVGIAPDTSLAEAAGLDVERGILIDEHCRTSDPNIFAAGDVANWFHPGLGHRLRVEHWDNALNQGAAAAKSMLGNPETYAPVLYFWSDQYDLNIQYLGHATEWDDIAVRGDPAEEKFSAFYLKDGSVHGALIVNNFRDIRPTRTLIGQKTPVDANSLSDTSTNLKQLARR